MPAKSLSKKTSSPAKKSKPSSKVSTSPEKKITSLMKIETHDVDLEALVKEHLTADLSSGASPSKKRKSRPAVVSSDSSDVELLEGPATPIKKRLRKMTTTPTPGSDAFKLLDAVSTSPTLEDAISRAGVSTPAIEFGSVMIDNDARPKRVTVRTPKAKAFEAEKALEETRLSSRRALKPAAVLSPMAVRKTLPSAATKAPVEAVPAAADSVSSAEMENMLPEDIGEELPDVAQVFSDVMRMKREGKQKASPLSVISERKTTPLADSLPIEEWSNSEAASEADEATEYTTNVKSESAVAKPAQAATVTIVEDSDSQPYDIGDTDESLNVMMPSCQDPMLAPTYKNLPKISRLCEVTAFSPCIESLRTPFSATCENMRKEEIRAFLKAVLFVKSGQYVNTARVDPALLIVENSRLRIRDTKTLAVCIMTGTLTESFVVESCEAGPRHAPYPIHKVTIAPLEQEWRRDVSVWGMLFNFHVISGMLSEYGFGFATRGEGKGDGWKNASAPSSPVKNRSSSSVLKAVSSPSIARTADSIFAASRSFDDRVPVYDGRVRNGHAAFMFTDADFRNLSSWPLYRKGSSDIPADSVVSIGYTLSSYKGASGPVLSSNIHFVIIISTPLS